MEVFIKKNGLLYEALDEYKIAIGINPNNFDAHSKSALIYLKLNDLHNDEFAFRSALHIKPDNEQIIKEIVQYFTEQNDMEGLAKYYQKLEEMKITDTKLGMAIGKYYYENGNYDKAMEMLNKLLTKEGITDEMCNTLLTYLTFTRFDKSNLTEAENFVLRIPEPFDRIDEQPCKKLALILSKIGANKININRKKDAIIFFEKAFECDPDNKQYQEIPKKNEILTARINFIRKALFIAGSAVAVW